MNESSRGPLDFVLVAAVAAAAVFWNLGGESLERHEAYVAVTARTMSEPDHWLDAEGIVGPIPPNTTLNHWLVPVCDGYLRPQKTPLAYWCVAGLAKLGLPVTELTARLPSAVSAVLLALLTLALGRRLLSDRAALLGALFLATSVAFFQWGRNARPDMMLCLWMTAAMTCFYLGINAGSRTERNLWLISGWLAVGMGQLAKESVSLALGLPIAAYIASKAGASRYGFERSRRLLVGFLVLFGVGLLLAVAARDGGFIARYSTGIGLSGRAGYVIVFGLLLGGPVLWYLARAKSWDEVRPLIAASIVGALLVAVMVAPWFWYVADLFPRAGRTFSYETIDRGLGTGRWLDHASSLGSLPWYYVGSILWLALPFTALLPGGLAAPFVKRFEERRDSLAFLFLWVVCLVLLFGAAAGKREHYILPAVPPACLLMGFFAEDVFWRRRWAPAALGPVIVVAYAVVVTIGAVGAGVAAIVMSGKLRPGMAHAAVMAGAAAIVLWYGAKSALRDRAWRAVGSMVAAGLVVALVYATRVDIWDRRSDLVAYARRAAELTPAGARVAAWPRMESTVVFYYGRDIPDAIARLDRLRAVHDRAPGGALWEEWMKKESPPLWLFVERRHLAEARSMGFVPAPGMEHPAGSKLDVFVLTRPPAPERAERTGPPEAEAAKR